jgi:hypothetical protein
MDRSLPVNPNKQTFSAPVGMSQTCHEETFAGAAPGGAGGKGPELSVYRMTS